jgi:predicted CoA-binding protein
MDMESVPMPIKNLSKIFQPRSVAVVGASVNAGSVGRTVVENLQRAEFAGDLYPINPKYQSILDLRAYPLIDKVTQYTGFVNYRHARRNDTSYNKHFSICR